MDRNIVTQNEHVLGMQPQLEYPHPVQLTSLQWRSILNVLEVAEQRAREDDSPPVSNQTQTLHRIIEDQVNSQDRYEPNLNPINRI